MLHAVHTTICVNNRSFLTFCFWLTAAVLSGNAANAQAVTDSPTDTSQAELASAKTSIEQTTRVHRLKTTKRSPFDAFVYLNRIPNKAAPEESPQDLAGRITGRLANQEGRVLLKAPSGMKMNAYMGLKTFLRSARDNSVGDCIACHSPPEFTDHKIRVGLDGTPIRTPSLRNLKRTHSELRRILHKKAMQVAHGTGSSKPYASLRLDDDDITQLIAFLDTLHDQTDAEFRKRILNAESLDTSDQVE